MAEIIRMPEILAGAEEAAVNTWFVSEGDAISAGQPLAEIETEKAVVEYQSEVTATVGRILVPAGKSVAVGDPLFITIAEGEGAAEIDAALAAAGASAQATAAPVETVASADESSTPAAAEAPVVTVVSVPVATTEEPSGRRFVSPLVRRLAKQHGVNLDTVVGSGPSGRIVRRDLEHALSAAPAAGAPVATQAAAPVAGGGAATAFGPAPFVDVPLSRMRKAIARRLTESKSTVPHFYLEADCRVDALLAARAELNAVAARKVSVNDFVLKAVAYALMTVPEANAIWNGDSLRMFNSVDISVAVAIEGGLTTPVVRGVERLSILELSAQVSELASRAREGRLKQEELEGGSFSVSNLGMYGTEKFSAILNPPQSGILAVGAARKLPVASSDGALEVADVMTVTLSADHRVVDGAVAAQWLTAFKRAIEHPILMLA